MIISSLLLFTFLIYFSFNYYKITEKRRLIPIYFKLNNKDFTKNRYSKKKVPLHIDTIIIGSGISGLTAASLLAKFGKKVLVLEQHYVAGGSTHVFEEDGIEHETGYHYIGNVNKRQQLFDILTDHKIEWCQLGEETEGKIYDEIIIGENHYKFESGVNYLKNYLIEKFPHEQMGLIKYFDLVNIVSKKDIFFLLKVFPIRFISKLIKYIDPAFYYYSQTSAYDTIKTLIKDEELISVLCGQMGDYGQTPKEASFFVHASIVNHYLDGGWYPKGGPKVIANNIIKTIEEHNGMVLVGQGVKSLFIRNNKCIGVIMNNKDVIYAEEVISSVGFKNTFQKLLENINYKDKHLYDNFLKDYKPSVQHLYTFVKLDGNPQELDLPSSNYWVYPHKDFEKVFKDFDNDPFEAPIPSFIAFSCAKDSSWQERYPNHSNAILITTVSKDLFTQWENDRCAHRSEEYKNMKNIIGKRLIDEVLLENFPQLKDKIISYNVATPLTTQYYFNNIDGDSYGMRMDTNRLLNGEIVRPRTSIDNLYLTGQDIITMGFTGAMMAGIMTANVVMKYDNFIDIIKGNNIVKELLNRKKII
jgi:all-trans-retinol 13,14-reductase